jgi:oligoribonuclease
VENALLDYIKRHVPEGKGFLAGNSVHVDKEFLKVEFPRVINWLHYRIIGTLPLHYSDIDVSTVKELSRMWSPKLKAASPEKKYGHRALEDIQESIRECKYYKDTLWKGHR